LFGNTVVLNWGFHQVKVAERDAKVAEEEKAAKEV